MNEWYEDLNGKEVTVIANGKKYKAVVSGFSYDLGYSIQDKETGEYLECYRGPMAPLNGHTEQWRAKRSIGHRKYLSKIAKRLRQGEYSLHEGRILYDIVSGHKRAAIRATAPSAETCAFAQ